MDNTEKSNNLFELNKKIVEEHGLTMLRAVSAVSTILVLSFASLSIIDSSKKSAELLNNDDDLTLAEGAKEEIAENVNNAINNVAIVLALALNKDTKDVFEILKELSFEHADLHWEKSK